MLWKESLLTPIFNYLIRESIETMALLVETFKLIFKKKKKKEKKKKHKQTIINFNSVNEDNMHFETFQLW